MTADNICEVVPEVGASNVAATRCRPELPKGHACNGPGASWTWGARGTPPAACLGRSASASLRPAPDLNVDAIKEKLLDHRIPESCV
ncbi:hypothetical protein KGM_211048 [Danaus plexippus plexippus]|uniref:Uncharacterized protein n=1 Tax=Danaus plexippus plexippus TaxID=278856 RepID=A0A212EX55_DANPL|nr:hypothetical protein KGM_211048 [Danaus plexippus plexippus]